jgi:hypothetical protein
MPRPKPFTKADIEQRQQLSDLTVSAHSENHAHARTITAFIEKMACRASMLDEQKEKFANEIRTSIQTYQLRCLQHKQELPARQAAALERVAATAERARRRLTPSALDHLQKELDVLPQPLRMELHVEDRPHHAVVPWLDGLIDAVEKRLPYWRCHVLQHRPSGESGIGSALRQSLLDILVRHSPDMRDADARRRDADARGRVESLLRKLGLRVPAAKKNRALFTGKQAETLHPAKLRRATHPSGEQRSRAKRLSGLTF